MTNHDFSATLLVSQSPKEVFDAINDVSSWWSEEMTGSTHAIGDKFTVRFGEVYITSEVVELVPEQKITWLVKDCNKPWLKNTKEWNGTKMNWEITADENQTHIHFTHIGLAPEIECFEVCSTAWGDYLQKSLLGLITTGKGKPTKAGKK